MKFKISHSGMHVCDVEKIFFFTLLYNFSFTLALSFALHFQSGARQSLNLAIRPDYLDTACITHLLFCLAYYIILILQYSTLGERLSLKRFPKPMKGDDADLNHTGQERVSDSHLSTKMNRGRVQCSQFLSVSGGSLVAAYSQSLTCIFIKRKAFFAEGWFWGGWNIDGGKCRSGYDHITLLYYKFAFFQRASCCL